MDCPQIIKWPASKQRLLCKNCNPHAKVIHIAAAGKPMQHTTFMAQQHMILLGRQHNTNNISGGQAISKMRQGMANLYIVMRVDKLHKISLQILCSFRS